MSNINSTGTLNITKRFSAAFLIIILSAVSVSCSTFIPNYQDPGSSVPERIPAGTFKFPVEGKRPVAVMIDNQGTRPLPQGGLYRAQFIYEALAEGGITRYMPVFYGTGPKQIGPVRSSRDYFVQYAVEHNAIYVHIGWSPGAKTFISNNNVNNINGLYDGIFQKITTDPGNWQDKYTSYTKIKKESKRKKYSTDSDTKPLFAFADKMTLPEIFNENTSVKDAPHVKLSYNTLHHADYKYNPKTGLYKRFRESSPHIERNTGKQLTCGNIIIQFVQNAAIIGDDKNRQELDNIGSGKGWYITMGKVIPIKWSKANAAAPTKYTYDDGSEITLNPAQTWIQITPPDSSLKFGKTKK